MLHSSLHNISSLLLGNQCFVEQAEMFSFEFGSLNIAAVADFMGIM